MKIEVYKTYKFLESSYNLFFHEIKLMYIEYECRFVQVRYKDNITMILDWSTCSYIYIKYKCFSQTYLFYF